MPPAPIRSTSAQAPSCLGAARAAAQTGSGRSAAPVVAWASSALASARTLASTAWASSQASRSSMGWPRAPSNRALTWFQRAAASIARTILACDGRPQGCKHRRAVRRAVCRVAPARPRAAAPRAAGPYAVGHVADPRRLRAPGGPAAGPVARPRPLPGHGRDDDAAHPRRSRPGSRCRQAQRRTRHAVRRRVGGRRCGGGTAGTAGPAPRTRRIRPARRTGRPRR
mmetsp:Transcript_7058/g.30054  ORF Transcript_7058/g.30054 Transcript_7058/m.30054 type:complete len:226 (-) Transcript_7058:1472-2149(-)